MNRLEATGRLEHTYILFTSDNGYHLGQHRLRNGKTQIYEEDIRVPLVVRGPKTPAGARRDHLVATIDIAPTIAKLARVRPWHDIDGQSFVDLLDDRAPPTQAWRKHLLIEVYRRLPPEGNGDVIRAIRTLDGVIYAEYESGPRELYDLSADPYQLDNALATASPGHVRELSGRLRELAVCAAESCR